MSHPKPPAVNPYGNNGIPEDSVVLFNGNDLSSWRNKDG